MLLGTLQVQDFRSVENSECFEIDERITALVGLNESGKTCILQAAHKTLASDGVAKFDVVNDFPRRKLAEYQRTNPKPHIEVVRATFELNGDELAEVAKEFGPGVFNGKTFSVCGKYDNIRSWDIPLDEGAAVRPWADLEGLDAGIAAELKTASEIGDAIKRLRTMAASASVAQVLDPLVKKYQPDAEHNKNGDLLRNAMQRWLLSRFPKTFYFDDYYLLPGKVNLNDLNNRKNDPQKLEESHRTILALLNVAGVTVEDLLKPIGYDVAKARLESISAEISDRIFEFWKQNTQLEVEFDISEDPADSPPYNSGRNLYVRIKNHRHRVTMPLTNRSKGFIWFFSFLIWFDQVKRASGSVPPILLLDEPGLNLHALAQADLLRYFEQLSDIHQVIYSTHSPFMVESDALDRVRVVQDLERVGTKVTSSLSGSDRNTLFPLQAALGYTIAQNLFVSKRNLIVEGPSDLLLLRFMANQLERLGKTTLREDVTIVPVGGGGNIAKFAALLHANELNLVVLVDYDGKPDQTLASLVKERVIPEKLVLTYAQFRGTPHPIGTDIEDLLPVGIYLAEFNEHYKGKLPRPLAEADLPPSDRVIRRIEKAAVTLGAKLRQDGTFNHYGVMERLVTSGKFSPDGTTQDAFAALFKKINNLFS